MQEAPEKFGNVAIALHWLIAAAVVFAAIVGLVSDYTNDTDLTRETLYIHQSIGVLVFFLAVARLAWRLTHTPPPLPAGMPPSHRLAAAATHILLYVLIFALPLTGYVALAARGREIAVFGLFNMPRLVPLGLSLAATAQNIHDTAQYALYALFALHVGAALYHQFILKDGVLARMWPARRKAVVVS